MTAACFHALAEQCALSRRVKGLHKKALMRMTYGLVSDVFWAWADTALDAVKSRARTPK